MVRTQIQLTEKQALALKQIAAEEEVSMAELIRRSVDKFILSRANLTLEERQRRALSVIGAFESGTGDLSENHDLYLTQAYDAISKEHTGE